MRYSLVAAAMVVLAGCAGVLGFDEFIVGPGTTDAGDDAAPSGEADLYVSVEGNDESDGSRQRPVRSIARALQLARVALAERKTVQRIAVCSGDYVERSLEVVGGIHVRGGYDCASWARAATEQSLALRIPPSTKLVSGAPDVTFVRLRADDLGAPRLDGLSIETTQAHSAIDVVGEATLVDVFVSNTTSPQDEEPHQVLAANKANVTIERAYLAIAQGGATGNAISIGVGASESTLVLRDNVFDLSSTAGSCQGIVATTSTVVAERNRLDLVDCRGTIVSSQELSAAVGVVVVDSKLESRRNTIRIDRPRRFEAGRTGAVGLTVLSGELESDGDRMIGPVLLGSQATAVRFVGVYVTARAKIVNASIFVDSRHYVLDNGSAGVHLAEGAGESAIAHNSMYFSAPVPGDRVRSYGILIDESIKSPSITIESNVAMTDNPDAMLLRVGSCAQSGIGKLANNYHGGFAAPVYVSDAGGCTLDDLVDGGAAANTALPCDAGSCGAVFESTEVVSVVANGLRPVPAAACAQLRVPSSPGVLVDGTGKPRTDGGSTTAGAFEVGCD